MQNRGHQPNPPAREGEGRDIIGGASAARANALCQIALGLSQERTGLERPYRDMRVSVGIVEGAPTTARSASRLERRISPSRWRGERSTWPPSTRRPF